MLIHEALDTTNVETKKAMLMDGAESYKCYHARDIAKGYLCLLNGEIETTNEFFYRVGILKEYYIPKELKLKDCKYIVDILVDSGKDVEAIEFVDFVFKELDYGDFNNHYKMVWNIISAIRNIPDGISIIRSYINEILYSYNLKAEAKVFFLRKMEALCILQKDYMKATEYIIDILNIKDYENMNYYRGKTLVDLAIISKNQGSSDVSIAILERIDTDIEDKVKKADLEIYRLINLAQNKNYIGKPEEALQALKKIDAYKNFIPEEKKWESECQIKTKEAEAYILQGNILKAREIVESISIDKFEKNLKSYITFYVDYLRVLGKLYLKEHKYNEAKEVYIEILKKKQIGYYDEKEALRNLLTVEVALGYDDEAQVIEERLKNLDKEWENFKVSMIYKYVEGSKNLKIVQKNNDNITRRSVGYIAILILAVLTILNMSMIPRYKIKAKKKAIIKNINNNKYFLVYQPIVNPNTRSIEGVETLLRLRCNGKVLSPLVFIADIESADMMGHIALWQLEEIKKNLKSIKAIKNRGEDFYVSINVSLNEIKNSEFIKAVKEKVKKIQIQGIKVCIEITENAGILDESVIKEHINELINSGAKIAIDDFGIEYSNISMLDKFDFHTIKLDKYFIDNITNSVVIESMFKVITEISQKLDISIVVEGVEEQWQEEFIKNYSKAKIYIQGYYYSKPIEIKELKSYKVDMKKN